MFFNSHSLVLCVARWHPQNTDWVSYGFMMSSLRNPGNATCCIIDALCVFTDLAFD
uniref:Uncharacterized protein n=1 Tax=Arundo donax TaxID=35708 RepID=A0A0A9C9Y9_ARUDO